MHDSLGLARRAAGVEHEEHILGVHRLWRAFIGSALDDVVPPDVAASLHVDVESVGGAAGRCTADTSQHHNFFNCRRFAKRFIDAGFQGHDCAAAPGAIGGDDDFGLGVIDALAQGFRRKAAKYNAMRSANLRAGEHGNCQLGNHAHINGHAIAFGNTE